MTVTLADEVDIARGDVITHPDSRPEVADQFTAHVIWMSAEQLLPGRSYLMKIGAKTTPATVTELKHRIDVNTLEKLAGKTLALNEVGFCNLATTTPIAFDPYADNRDTGAFILIDRFTNETAAAGMIAHGLRRATNIHRHDLTVSRDARAQIKHQRAAILWFTGLSGAGKSVIANLVEAKLHRRGVHTVMLDGDNVRHGLNKDLGFTAADRVENIRRVGEVARLMTEAGLIVLCSFISPFRAERALVRDLAAPGEFVEIFVDAPIETVIARDGPIAWGALRWRRRETGAPDLRVRASNCRAGGNRGPKRMILTENDGCCFRSGQERRCSRRSASFPSRYGSALALGAEAKTLRFAFQGELKSVDPYQINESFSISVNLAVYEGLIRRGPDMKKEPCLQRPVGRSTFRTGASICARA